MKKLFKKVLPYSLKNFISKYLIGKISVNIYKKKNKKNALLSYVNKVKQKSLTHTNYFEVLSWVQILDSIGYNVDVIDYRNEKKIDLAKYDIICGFGEVFKNYFETLLTKNIITIYYGTGMHVCHQNNVTLNRVKDVFINKGAWLGKSARYVEKTWTHQTTLVDGIIALGNEICAESYKKYFNGKVYSLPAPFYKTTDVHYILNNRKSDAHKHYLWFGGSGLIHKGLDLLLDYFSKNKDIYLHVCGPIQNEQEFEMVFFKQLYENENIMTHGFVDIGSEKFHNILCQCNFIIFPSCSEGGAASVVTAVGCGGLIPIITKETSFSTGHEIWIETLDQEGVQKAVDISKSLTIEEIKYLQRKNAEYVLLNHNQDHYYNELKKYINIIIKKSRNNYL